LSDNDFCRQQLRFTGDNATVNAALLDPVHEMARARGATLGQIALARVQQRTQVHGLAGVVPISGTRRRVRVDENAAATHLVLTDSELALFEPIAGRVAGDRYADMTFTSAGRA
jgi:aryl-alcohol dehydrogenase-like predicted oxidoreductase